MSDLVFRRTEVPCEICGSVFIQNRSTHRFCSTTCRSKGKYNPPPAKESTNLPGEEWRPVHLVDHAPYYQVSNMGRIKSNAGGTRDWQLMLPRMLFGYMHITLWHNKKHRQWRLHRLVLMAFKGQPEPGQEAAHLNGKRDDNRLENLAWETSAVNASHRIAHGTQARGETHPSARLNKEQVLAIRAIPQSEFDCRTIAELYRVHPSTISAIRTGKRWKNV